MKRYIVIGSGNIGFGVIERLSQEGEVSVFDIRKPDYLSDLMDRRDNIFFSSVDATDEESMETVVSSLQKGTIDGAVLTVGVSSAQSVFDDINAFRRTININFFGNIIPLRALVRNKVFKDPGKVIVLISTSGHFAGLSVDAYAPSKWMLANACDSIRAELEKQGITLDMINPRTIKNVRSEEFKSSDGIDVSLVVDTIIKALGGVHRKTILFLRYMASSMLSRGSFPGCLTQRPTCRCM